MKRVLTISLVICGLLMFTGCGETKTNKYEETMKEYSIKELPSLLIFKNNELLGHIDGYYENDSKEELLSKLNEIIK